LDAAIALGANAAIAEKLRTAARMNAKSFFIKKPPRV
jgi:hypothetical protein